MICVYVQINSMHCPDWLLSSDRTVPVVARIILSWFYSCEYFGLQYDDVSGRVTKETTKLTKNKDVVKNYSYDSAGNKSAFAVKVGDDTKLSLQYIYDGESKLTSVTDEKGNQVVGYDYDTDGNLSERTVAGNNLTTTYAYDYQNHLTSLKNQTSKGVISEYTSEYLTNGQKAKETADTMDEDGKKSKKTATYTYDLLGRITKETKTGSEDISYTYDSNNNRKEMKVGNKVTAYKYNKNDELLRTDTLNTDTEEDSVVIYKNDKNGNQLATVNRYEIPGDKKDSTYVDIDVTLGDNRLNENVVNHYNALNQLTQTLTKNYKVSFTYDAEGLRTSKTVNGEKTVFVWDGDQLVMELSESGKVQKRYIRGNDRGYDSNLVYADKGTGTEKQYYVTDPHGNVIQLTDESGAVIKTYEYDSFGNEVNPDRKDENPFRYCGEYYDKETEEIYLRARYYQPVVGRFLIRDSYTGEEDEPLRLHLYAYCGNDGVNSVDPSGHKYVHSEKSDFGDVEDHYKYNKKHDYFANYIYGQKNKKVKKMKFQNETIGTLGCGPVAVYNAFIFTGRRHLMSMVIKEVEDAYQPCWEGGATVGALSKVLKDHNILSSEKEVKNQSIKKKMDTGDSFILLYQTKKGGNHYVFGVYLESRYRIWNFTENGKKYKKFRSLMKIKNLKKMIHIFWLDRCAWNG